MGDRRSFRSWVLGAGVAAAGLAGCQPASTEAARSSDESSGLSAVGAGGRLRFALQLQPPAPATGRLFRVITEVRDVRSGAQVKVSQFLLDATMPEHAHGMSTRPVHRGLGGGRYESEGMRLHMPGLWHFEVEAKAADAGGRLLVDRAVLVFEQPVARPDAPAGAK